MGKHFQAVAVTASTLLFIAFLAVEAAFRGVATEAPDSIHSMAWRFGRRRHHLLYITPDQHQLLSVMFYLLAGLVALVVVNSVFTPRQRSLGGL